MRKYILVIILLIGLSIIFFDKSDDKENTVKEFRGVYISYIDLDKYFKDDNYIDTMIKVLKENKLNTVILQIRSFGNSIYDSDIFSNSYNYDVLKKIISKSKENNIDVYGWINPYRISNKNDISVIYKDSLFYKYINTDTLKVIDKGIYLNPSDDESLKIILSGVEEVLKKYDVKGILYDDYFYPSIDIDIDNYKLNGNGLDIYQYHINVINKLISETKKLTTKYKVNFSVSPDANNENNYKNGVCVKDWIDNNYVDIIMPQIYYGFYNETKPFIKVLDEWEELVKESNVSLVVGLALYKSGSSDNYALNGSLEWVNNSDILMREIILSRLRKNYKGFSLYRYDYLINKNTTNTVKEVENIKKIL